MPGKRVRRQKGSKRSVNTEALGLVGRKPERWMLSASERMVAGVLRQGGHGDTVRVTEKASLCAPNM